MEEQNQKKTKMTQGGRNLVILGILSVVFSVVATSVSLAIYHNSGDIYLDRSRPGFLPDEEEIEEEENKEEEYNFEKSGKITIETIEEYLEKLQTEVRVIDGYEEPFGGSTLSDERLGISEYASE